MSINIYLDPNKGIFETKTSDVTTPGKVFIGDSTSSPQEVTTPYLYTSTENPTTTLNNCTIGSFATGRWLTTRQGVGPGPQSGDLVTMTYSRAILVSITNTANLATFSINLPFTAIAESCFYGASLDFFEAEAQPTPGYSTFNKSVTTTYARYIFSLAEEDATVNPIYIQNVMIRYLAA